MELKIRLHRLRGDSLPLNYQYPLSSWIYKIIGAADAGYSAFLHENGFSLGARKFKMFTFSQLDLRPYEISGERIILKGNDISLTLRFSVDASLERRPLVNYEPGNVLRDTLRIAKNYAVPFLLCLWMNSSRSTGTERFHISSQDIFLKSDLVSFLSAPVLPNFFLGWSRRIDNLNYISFSKTVPKDNTYSKLHRKIIVRKSDNGQKDAIAGSPHIMPTTIRRKQAFPNSPLVDPFLERPQRVVRKNQFRFKKDSIHKALTYNSLFEKSEPYYVGTRKNP